MLVQLLASDHYKMKLSEHFNPELKILNIHFSHIV